MGSGAIPDAARILGLSAQHGRFRRPTSAKMTGREKRIEDKAIIKERSYVRSTLEYVLRKVRNTRFNEAFAWLSEEYGKSVRMRNPKG